MSHLFTVTLPNKILNEGRSSIFSVRNIVIIQGAYVYFVNNTSPAVSSSKLLVFLISVPNCDLHTFGQLNYYSFWGSTRRQETREG
uniref:Uncharacterized protein n=1 Tax=Mesocestoides corti TaxID=53468 RepID=A0A5K3EIW3_MESCO